MTYEISPSTLKAGLDPKFGCPRCLWLKVKHDVRVPDMSGLGKLHNDIHGFVYEYLKTAWIDLVPRGRLIETELHVKSKPVHDIALHGYIDALIALDTGGYCIMDIKTTTNTAWIHKNYALQVNVYRHCLEHADNESPAHGPVSRLGILSFSPNRFALRTCDNAGIAGCLEWHEIRADDSVVGSAIGEAAVILAGDIPPYTDACEWCQFYRKWGDPFDAIRAERVLFS